MIWNHVWTSAHVNIFVESAEVVFSLTNSYKIITILRNYIGCDYIHSMTHSNRFIYILRSDVRDQTVPASPSASPQSSSLSSPSHISMYVGKRSLRSISITQIISTLMQRLIDIVAFLLSVSSRCQKNHSLHPHKTGKLHVRPTLPALVSTPNTSNAKDTPSHTRL